ncbi:hypothetical protein [Streptomyces sp. NPDC058653]|uniref:hypothetical protein n=1 Tax=Streptomyces sp. NPDC058653 TaxID=3346576 RepID=UPI0036537B75
MTAATGIAGRIPEQLFWNGLRVPYVAPWSGEVPRLGQLVERRGCGGVGLGYADEVEVVDRFETVLWTRVPLGRGRGKSALARVHPLRQRRCMRHQLCQVCGGSVVGSRADERFLFVMGTSDGREIAEGEVTAVPPVHEACARESLVNCPHLREGWAAAFVGYASAWGVAGVAYHPETLQPLPASPGEDLTFVRYGDDLRTRWILAAREAVSLHEVTPVDLSDLGLAV